MKKQRKDIFISYRRKNGGLETAERIRDRLIDLGYTVFMDLHNIDLGEEFPAKIVNAIRSCKEVLLVLPPDSVDKNGNTSNALGNKWVMYEISYALNFEKNIIPILMEGYEFPEKNSYPELPEEFNEFPEITEKFRKIHEKNGIKLKIGQFDDDFKHLKKDLKSRPKWNIKKKILVPTCTILLLLSLLITGKCVYNSYLPLFSLSLTPDDNSSFESDNQSWNMNYLITNKGGQLAGGKVTPSLRIGLKIVSTYEGYNYKYGFFDIEFYDFYEDSYFFDDQNNTVSIFESKADKLVTYIDLMEEQLEKENMYINMYAVKMFFEIDYTDIFNINHRELYEAENNYNYLFTNWGTDTNQDNEEDEFVRYCSDNTLIKVWEIDDALFSVPLLNSNSSQIASDIKDDVKYIIKHQNKILKTNIADIEEAEDADGNTIDVPTEYLGKAAELIEGDNGLLIGVHIKHKRCSYQEDLKWYEQLLKKIEDIYHI